MEHLQKELNGYVQILTAEHISWEERRSSVHNMHGLFVRLGALDALQEVRVPANHTQLPSGRAIAPIQAGMCLLEVRRTKVFVEGLRDAIADLLQQLPGKTIRVFDAGCGPYALLPLLATQFFSPQQVQFTVLDIHKSNLESAKTLISNLGLNGYFDMFVLADATAYQCTDNTRPDIVISETMNRALQKEPQVAITLNLAAQLPPHGILIPEAIAVSLYRTKAGLMKEMMVIREEDETDFSQYEEELGFLMTLDRHSTLAVVTQQPLQLIAIPNDYDKAWHNLRLYTFIRVYQHHLLQRYNCSLTLPLNLESPGRMSVQAGDILDFHYTLGAMPGLEFKRQPRGEMAATEK
jgi:predicted RNA methylase